MISPHAIRPHPPQFNITPLIDVVFLLIIFFLVSSHLVQQDVSIELDLPAAETGRPSEFVADRTMVVSVSSAEHFYLGKTPTTLAELEDELLRGSQRLGRPVAVRLRLARNVPYETLESLLVVCTRCGVSDIAFAVTENQ
ncbi:MAG: ExbD/TolR family protein [Thermoguttaceae bacterium]